MVDPISLIARFEHLPGRPKSDQARPLLEKIASQVKPIMKKRGWKVGTLAEFLPSNPSLLGLNVNAGQRINLRLRPPGNENTFYEYDQLVLVMLHELTHNVHGPHDAKFYKLLEELEEEYYELKRKGYSGEGFHGQGNHLSGLRVPEHIGRQKGLEAAEKRMNVQKVIGRGGVLGGSRNMAGKSMKELIIEAAERRLRDDKSCAVGHGQQAEDESRKAQKESIGVDAVDLQKGLEMDKEGESSSSGRETDTSEAKVIDLTGDSDDEVKSDEKPDEKPNKIPKTTEQQRTTSSSQIRSTTTNNSQNKPTSSSGTSTVSRPLSSTINTPKQVAVTRAQEWTCEICTLINPPSSTKCEACLTPKPASLPVQAEGIKTDQGWYCTFCTSGPNDMERWSCGVCGEVRKWG
ncbi:hypothetical protein I203_102366 [Kwoniella mangroviensis CBS 8507]|uniref:uncharacterized protein n=1 Tax=Kwoniella mangroviensis CBS 8507 TaxID=1296122 RepID=UPI00080D098B|nr:uncharacterized protein I203_06486 [Kwoniella mangroviensis CBS 8507]OCF64305.1 hypothetical protein I203_06486 [Kwoniella mangroviensis CBS 8507]